MRKIFEPRAYANTPTGLNFLIAGDGDVTGGVATDPALPLQNATSRSIVLSSPTRLAGCVGGSGKADVAVPYAWLRDPPR